MKPAFGARPAGSANARWASHLGMTLEMEGKDVTFNPRAQPSRVILPSYAIVTGPSRIRIVEQQAGHAERLTRDQRDPKLFIT